MGRRQPRRLPRRRAGGHRGAAHRPHGGGAAVPRRDRRLADGGAHPVRRQGPCPVGAGGPAPAPHRGGEPGRRHLVGRRHRLPLPRPRRAPGGDRGGALPRRDRRPPARGGGRLGAVHVPVPRGGGPRPAAAPSPSRVAHPAVAAAAPSRRAARGRRQTPRLPHRVGDVPRGAPGPLRPPGVDRAARRHRRPPGPGPRARAERPQPVRLLAHVRLRRLVHVRVRRPGGGAAGGGAHPRSAAAGRPARRSRPQGPARPGGDRPGRARAPAPRPGTEGALRRRRPRCPPPPGAADPRRAAGAGGTARTGRWPSSPASSTSAGSRRWWSTGRRGSPPSRTSPGCATHSGWRRPRGCPPPCSNRHPTRSATWSAGTPAPTGRSPWPRRPPPWASRPPWWPRCSTGSPVPAGSPAAATAAGRTRRSGWTWRCCVGSGGDRLRCCAPRSRRSTSPRSVASCPPGRASARNRARPSDSTRWCASSKAPPSPPESSSRPCSPAGSPIHRRCSMRCSPPVTWCGWAGGRWRARTAGSPSTCAARCRRWRPHSTSSHPRARSTRPCAPPSPPAAPRSSTTSSPQQAGRPTTRCSRRSGTWSGRAR